MRPAPRSPCSGWSLTAALTAWKVRGAILIGILATTIAGWVLGLVAFTPQPYGLTAISQTAFQLDLAGVSLRGGYGIGLLEILFVFLFVDLFDNVGTLVAVTKRAGPGRRADGTHPAAQPHPVRRFDRHHLRRARRHQHRHLLYRERRRRAGGRAHRPHRVVTGLLFLARPCSSRPVPSSSRSPPPRRP